MINMFNHDSSPLAKETLEQTS
uniref:Uncharacterized protein n=1 Tax=Rhizophora mucronata TaxID=61149 RepID=A0A2P2P537_RHIMU